MPEEHDTDTHTEPTSTETTDTGTAPETGAETGSEDGEGQKKRRRRRRRRKPAGERSDATADDQPSSNEAGGDETSSGDREAGESTGDQDGEGQPKKKRRRRRRGKSLGGESDAGSDDGSDSRSRSRSRSDRDEGEPRRDGRPESTSEDAKVSRTRSKRDASNVDIFDHDKSFADLGLSESLCEQLASMHFQHPTHIQSQLIPPVLKGKDVLGQAKTGTGKTAAFGLPLLDLVKPGEPNQALVLAPTRELAIQIHKEIEELGHKTNIRSVPIYGGQKIPTQAAKLEKGCEVVVGTPGRIMDMQRRGYLPFYNFKFVVLDEVDRMLDIGFREDIKYILSKCPAQRQTMFVSATLTDDIEKLAHGYMNDPEKIVTTAGSLTASMVKQYHMPVQPWDKRKLLYHLLTHEEPDLTLVFCRLKRKVDDLATYLRGKGIEAHAMHADLAQGKRNNVMEKLRSGHLSVLIASDLASRGIDVENITHVINYDLPDDIELYVHRIGRTARAGSGGTAWSFVEPAQGPLLTDIENHVNAEIPKLEYPDFVPGEPPKGWIEDQKRKEEQMQVLRQKANRGAPPPLVAEPAKADPSKFPGGVVPTKLPPKRLGGKVRGRR